jgi:DNA-binding protein H-NS
MPRGRDADLSALSLSALRVLRARIDAEIESRMGAEDEAVRARGGLVERDGPRYRNPENSAETWSGKEPRPSWVGEALAKGYTLSELEILDDRPTRTAQAAAARKSGRRA